jgi:hypothetical protein
MQAIFAVQKKVEQGTTNPMSARLTVQVINLLQSCGADQKVSQEYQWRDGKAGFSEGTFIQGYSSHCSVHGRR